jgi:hypothetical protein
MTSSTTIAPSAYQIEQAMSAYQQAVAEFQQQYPETGAEDNSLAMVAATDNISDLIERLIRSMLEAEMMETAVEDYMARLEARKDRWGRWAARTKALATEILEIVGWPTPIRYPDFTVSKGGSPPRILIVDASLLPDEFCKVTRTPVLSAIRRAMEAGHTVPGVEAGNPHTYLKVLRR